MITIEKQPIGDAAPHVLANAIEGFSYSHRKPEARLAYGDGGFTVEFTVFESNPRREETKHLNFVHFDSCVEWFVNFSPSTSDRYINFEVNANGTMYAAFRKDRYDFQLLKEEEIESFGITAKRYDDRWTVTYTVGFDFIKRYYPAFDIAKKETMRGNLYKTGDKTEEKHYLTCFPIPNRPIDFHCPARFGEFAIG